MPAKQQSIILPNGSILCNYARAELSLETGGKWKAGCATQLSGRFL